MRPTWVQCRARMEVVGTQRSTLALLGTYPPHSRLRNTADRTLGSSRTTILRTNPEVGRATETTSTKGDQGTIRISF